MQGAAPVAKRYRCMPFRWLTAVNANDLNAINATIHHPPPYIAEGEVRLFSRAQGAREIHRERRSSETLAAMPSKARFSSAPLLIGKYISGALAHSFNNEAFASAVPIV
ncbi:MAG: hypothetical protein K0R61_519 [Microvirga sp.]|jgi:hypothetical protein|nr:hypothetical protein [Microvirga sp.]